MYFGINTNKFLEVDHLQIATRIEVDPFQIVTRIIM
jgi:hypothetical protein